MVTKVRQVRRGNVIRVGLDNPNGDICLVLARSLSRDREVLIFDLEDSTSWRVPRHNWDQDVQLVMEYGL